MEAFAVAPPGFEDLVAAELTVLGLAGVSQVPGGVEFSGTWADVYRANLWSRVASRVLVRVARFEARGFRELARGLQGVEWGPWLHPGAALDVRVTKRRTRLYHTGAVAEAVHETLSRCAGSRVPLDGEAGQRLQVRIEGPLVELSLDTSGDHLHRRGYRSLAGPAPLRENLAAGLLLRVGYRGDEPLLDPLCGSGTFAVEGALLALGRAPGRSRAFAFQAFPGFDAGAWEALGGDADARALPALPAPVFASDRDPAAVALAVAAARGAGLADHLQVAVADVGELEAPAPQGLVATNPPYGHRLGGAGAAQGALGRALGRGLRGWRWAVVLPRGGRFGGTRWDFRSGGLALELAAGGPGLGRRGEV